MFKILTGLLVGLIGGIVLATKAAMAHNTEAELDHTLDVLTKGYKTYNSGWTDSRNLLMYQHEKNHGTCIETCTF